MPHHQVQLRPIPDRGAPSIPKCAKPNKQRSGHSIRSALCPGPALTTLEWQIPENHMTRPALARANAVPRENWAHHWHITQRHGTCGWSTSPARPPTLPACHHPQCSRDLAPPSPATTAPQPRSRIFCAKAASQILCTNIQTGTISMSTVQPPIPFYDLPLGKVV